MLLATEAETKVMSSKLLGLIKKAATSLLDLGQLWTKIKEIGAKEGFSEKELEQRIRKELWQLPGMTKHKIYYFFHREKKLESVKGYQKQVSKRRKFPTPDVKNGKPEVVTKDPKDIAESTMKFNPKHFSSKNIHYYDIQYLRDAVLYFFEECQRLKNK